MKRRTFFCSTLVAGLGLTTGRAHAAPPTPDPERIDPYFLDPGDVSPGELQSIEEFIGYQEDAMAGRPAVLPRGGRPKRAPTYRFLHWQGDPGDSAGRWIGPLSVSPGLEGPGPFLFNAQILGFNVSTRDWSGSKGHGTLSIEFRARHLGEPMTWLFLQQFETVKGGGTSVGLEFVAQRDGAPAPVLSEESNLDMRIQLIRFRKSPGVLRKILKVGAFVTGRPVGGGGRSYDFSATEPVLRVPRLAREGVAFAQATVGGMSEEAPIWRGGFTTYSLTPGGSRLAMRPGLWVALDDSQEIDYKALRLEEAGSRLGLVQEGRPANLNYLVLDLHVEGPGSTRSSLPDGVVPKGETD